MRLLFILAILFLVFVYFHEFWPVVSVIVADCTPSLIVIIGAVAQVVAAKEDAKINII
jgi:hypothetical protein